ncbi:MAG: leucine-rich repeat protein, partial [Kiritimatiellae bacterium]|nr:leucine-rich repeat protein [Kiritimatiellia bacterium]
MIKSNWMLAILLLCGMAVRMTLGELCGDSTPVVINTLDDPVVATSAITWDASWVGGNSSATVVIKDNGTEIKRAAGTGELAWTPATVGPHTLTYTTFINNVAQSEVYTVTLYSEWKYTVSNGTATITETTHKTGNVTIPDSLNGYPVIGIGSNVFNGCSSLMSVTIPTSVTSVGSNAFMGCTGLTTVSVPWSLNTPLSTLFPDAYANLTSVTMTGTTPTTIVADLYKGCTKLKSATIPSTVTSIGASAFYGCSSLTSVTIPNSVTSIGANAFYGCSGLTGGLIIPDSVTTIGDSAFSGCGGLTEVTMKPGNKTLRQLFPNAYATLTKVTLKDGPKRLPVGFFDGCSAVTQVTLPSTLTSIGLADLPPLVRASLSYDEDGFIVYQGWVLGHNDSLAEWLVLPEVKGIGASAFREFHELNEVYIPGTVKYIGANAFELCDYLDNVEIPDSVEEIGEDAFLLCSWVENLSIGVGVKHVGERAFKGCASLLSVLFPGALETVGAEAFSNDWRMLSIDLPGSVTNIGANAFKDCRGLTGVSVPAGVGTMQSLFPNAYSQIATVAVPAGADTIQANMFAGCTALADVTLPGGIESIGANAFLNCSSLPELVFPASLTSIGAGAFNGTAITNAYYLCMAAPACAADAFSTSPSNLTHYVIRGSKGWDGTPTSRVLPELWRGRAITWWTPNVFDVTFNVNGGVFPGGGTTATVSETTDAGYNLPPVNPTRPGFVFVGWWTEASGGTQVFSSTRVTMTREHTLYAHWQAKEGTFAVTFNATGGTVDPATRLVSNGMEVGELPTPTRENYSFDGWYTAMSGGTLVTATTTVDADVTYYARWTVIQYTVTFNANGGSVSPTTRTVDSGTAVGTLPTPTRTNYTFAGWYTAASGGTLVTATTTVDADVTYYARWTAIQYTVTFNANGGSVSPTTRTVNSGAAVGTLPTPTRTNYTFRGWFTAASGGTQVTASTVVSANVTYYARWTPQNLYCVIDLSGGSSATNYPVTYLDAEPSGGFNTDEYKTTKLVLRQIEAGTFIMGNDQTNESHRVTLTRPFYIGVFEVTQRQYELVTGSNPSQYTGNMRPVEKVTYNAIRGSSEGAKWPNSSLVDSGSFMGMIRLRTGLAFDLPTDAQWEYACRAGTTNDYNNGGSTEDDLKLLGRYKGNTSDGNGGYSANHTKAGSYQPNAWGLYDMHGNVWEICLDWYGTSPYGTDPKGPSSGSARMSRGGGWTASADRCTSSTQAYLESSDNRTGFRLCRTVYPEETACVVTFDANGGNVAEATRSVNVGAAVGELPTPTRAGYSFDGWFTAAVGGTRVDASLNITDDVTLYAWWIADSATRYCVIDLSGGSAATNYPVTYLAEPPTGGFNTDEYKTTKLVLRQIDPGTYQMQNVGTVTLTKPFYIGLFEVTQKQYQLVTGSNPSNFSGEKFPVEKVSYKAIRGSSNGAMWPTSSAVDEDSFMGKLRVRTGLAFDLPTEAQWEYACRAGTTTTYGYGNSVDGSYMWYKSNSSSTSHNVGSRTPNEWGLYDMHGNVDEWCLDRYGTLEYGTDPKGSSSELTRVKRGGGWYNYASNCTSSYRYGIDPSNENSNYGFRLCRTLGTQVLFHTVTFNANGGSVSPATRKVENGSMIGTLPVPTRDGYTFDGWFTAATGGTQVTATTVVNANATYYAHWARMVTFDANGGEVTPATKLMNDGVAVGELPIPTRDNYIFIGWFTAATGGTQVTATTVVTGAVTYYAHWKIVREEDGGTVEYFEATVGGYTWTYTVGHDGGATLASIRVVTNDTGSVSDWGSDTSDDGTTGGDTGVDCGWEYYQICVSPEPDGAMAIPASLDGHPVTGIGDHAFDGCGGLTGVTIPESVKEIGRYAFYDCSELAGIELPSGLESIGEGAFEGCASLSSVDFPQGLVWIDSLTFSGCSSLEQVTLPTSLKVIDYGAFEGCVSLGSVDFPEGLVRIDSDAFNGCSSLEQIALPSSLRVIGHGVFSECSSLSSVTVPSGVTSLGYALFEDCSSLTEVAILTETANVCDDTFCGWTPPVSLRRVLLPGSFEWIVTLPRMREHGVEVVYGNAFTEPLSPNAGTNEYFEATACGYTWTYTVEHDGGATLVGIRVVTNDTGSVSDWGDDSGDTGDDSSDTVGDTGGIWWEDYQICVSPEPDGALVIPPTLDGHPVTGIGDHAFDGCGGLTGVTIPESVNEIGRYAFYGCSALEHVTLPSGLKVIGECAFGDCASLGSVDLPEGLVRIDSYAFSGCS